MSVVPGRDFLPRETSPYSHKRILECGQQGPRDIRTAGARLPARRQRSSNLAAEGIRAVGHDGSWRPAPVRDGLCSRRRPSLSVVCSLAGLRAVASGSTWGRLALRSSTRGTNGAGRYTVRHSSSYSRSHHHPTTSCGNPAACSSSGRALCSYVCAQIQRGRTTRDLAGL